MGRIRCRVELGYWLLVTGYSSGKVVKSFRERIPFLGDRIRTCHFLV